MICGLVFAYASINKILDAVAIGIIITMVFKDYFGKDDRKQENQPTEVTK